MSVGLEPPYGWGGPEPWEAIVFNSGTVDFLQWDHVMLDIVFNDSETTTNTVGAQNSCWANINSLTGGARSSGITAICQVPIAAREYGKVMIRGITMAHVGTSSTLTAPTAGTKLWVEAGLDTYLDVINPPAFGVGAIQRGILTTDGAAAFAAIDEPGQVAMQIYFDGVGISTYAAS